MTDLDAALEGQPTAPPTPGLRTVRRHRHEWITETADGLPPCTFCFFCLKVQNPTASRRGKNNRKRGNALELWFCRQLGLEKVGQMGTETDGRTPEGYAGNSLLVAQVKSGLQYPTWMQKILDGLPRTGGRVPILGIVQTPGPGKRRRALVVLDLDDFRDLYGRGNDPVICDYHDAEMFCVLVAGHDGNHGGYEHE